MRPDRRQFCRVATLGGGAALFGLFVPDSVAGAAAPVDALLLSCMDYRLVDETERYMSGRGLRNKYDHIVLAGASLGAVTDKFPAWGQTFWQHLEVAIQLHQVHKVIVLDHRDCGAYKTILGEESSNDPARETAAHTTQLHKLRDQIKQKQPALEVELLLMAVDGKVTAIA